MLMLFKLLLWLLGMGIWGLKQLRWTLISDFINNSLDVIGIIKKPRLNQQLKLLIIPVHGHHITNFLILQYTFILLILQIPMIFLLATLPIIQIIINILTFLLDQSLSFLSPKQLLLEFLLKLYLLLVIINMRFWSRKIVEIGLIVGFDILHFYAFAIHFYYFLWNYIKFVPCLILIFIWKIVCLV